MSTTKVSSDMIDLTDNFAFTGTVTGAGAWTLIGTQVLSTAASGTQTGLDSTYDVYVVVVSDMVVSGDASHMAFQVGDSSGIDSGAADYDWHLSLVTAGSTSYVGNVNDDHDRIVITPNVGNAAGEGMGAILYITRPADGATQVTVFGSYAAIKDSGIVEGGVIVGCRSAVITLDRVKVLPSGGTISGRMSVYGISHA